LRGRPRGLLLQEETMSSREEFEHLFREFLAGRLSRRQMITRTTAASAGLAGVALYGPGTILRASAQSATPAASASPVNTTPDPNAKKGGRIKVGLQADPTAFDAQTQSLTAIWHVNEHIYSRLTKVKPDLTVEPDLAESIEISSDGITYTIKLRPGVKFHDGSDLKASDVVFTYKRLVDPATASPSAADLDSMKDIAAPDDSTVVITLKTPDASFMGTMSGGDLSILSEAVGKANKNNFADVVVGTGPFVYKDYVPNTSVTVDKNPNYFIPELPFLDGIDFTIASTDSSRTAALVSGTVDFIEYAPLADIDTTFASGYTVTGSSNTNIRFLAMNLRKTPFDNPKVRQAISKVIDRGPIIASPALFGHGTPVEGLFPPDNWAGLTDPIPAPDIDGAKQLMKDAGMESGFKTKITSWAQYTFLNAAATVIQEQLKAINIDAELNFVENDTMNQQVYVDYDFEIAVTGDSGFLDPNTICLNYFKSTSGGNISAYKNDQVDKWIAEGIVETDIAKRAEIYKSIQKQLLVDLPWVNLFVANQFEAMKEYVKGYYHIPTGSNSSLSQTWLDK
jgi:peptide/nickel transport system substrate-binding protein